MKSPDHLRLVPGLPPDCWDPIDVRAEHANETDIDRYVRQKFGGKIVAIACDELFTFENENARHATGIRHSGKSVAGVYLGIEYVTTGQVHRDKERESLQQLELINCQEIPLAVFSTGHGPLGDSISSEQHRRMEDNDTSIASFHKKIGVRLDRPVSFGRLTTLEEREAEQTQAYLRVVE